MPSIALLLLLLTQNVWALLDTPATSVTPSKVPVIDLSNKPWGQGERHRLDGYWHGYWNEFLDPTLATLPAKPAQRVHVPGYWSTATQGDQSLPALGYMSYYSRIKLPPERTSLYLSIPDMPSAYRLWVDGKLVAQNGQPAYLPGKEIPAFKPKVVALSAEQPFIDIVIHLSNYHYREGGIWSSLELSDQSSYFDMAQKPVILAIFFAATLIAFGLYNLLLFAFRSQERSALFFGLLCLAIGFRRLLIDERVLYGYDGLSWASLQRLEHLFFYLALPLFMSFFAALYRPYATPLFTRLSWWLCAPFITVCLLFPNRIYTELNIAFQVVILAALAAVLIDYVRASKHNADNIKTFGISLLIMGITVIHDILKVNDLISSPYNLSHVGLLTFMVSQSIALQRRYWQKLEDVERLSSHLQTRNQELLSMDQFRDEFLAMSSNELRTPLQGISSLTKNLQQDPDHNWTEQQRHSLNVISQTSHRLNLLVTDILEFSSIRHGKLQLEKRLIDVQMLFDLVISSLQPSLEGKQIELSAQVDPGANYIEADPLRLQQVLINLLGNAIEYTQLGQITLRAGVVDHHFELKISDTGLGIPEDKQASLFKPFETIYIEGRPDITNTGLGLAISKQLVELHEGTLTLESFSNQGTTVTITLPSSVLVTDTTPSTQTQSEVREVLVSSASDQALVDQSKAVYESDNAHIVGQSNHTNTLVFIVDATVIGQELLSKLVSDQGHHCDVFDSPISLLARLNTHTPDLLLINHDLPAINGLELCALVRKHYDNYELPIILLTAEHQISDIVSALNAGANDYLIKPYHDKELLARLQNQLTFQESRITKKENKQLKHEIVRRKGLEDTLSELNARLSNVLDARSELILIVNHNLHIMYANQRAVQELAGDEQGLVGQRVLNLFNPELAALITQQLTAESGSTIHVETCDFMQTTHWQVSIKTFLEQSENYLTLLITPQGQFQKTPSDSNSDDPHQKAPGTQISGSTISQLSQELNKSKAKIDNIEGALRAIVTDSQLSDFGQQIAQDAPESGSEAESLSGSAHKNPASSDQALNHTPNQSQGQNNKELVVSLLKHSLSAWERATQQGKVDLAERSRCWRVYVDGTTVKTRTFDKYLSVRTVPDRPRWRAVVRTAQYVLENCPLSTDEQAKLTKLSNQVEDRYS